ncbi:YafY family protein [Petroclostridium sp. X23]|uniref:helix-turn-helix transcriptional regulator n=1 Tax=Petroclostridium sp. X23 TaxID=3045146 RepID=UPI0024AE6619|nr:YafY family protein [Petroclostridium sp. X23]WHH57131.1 YafY family protein [Petroclostridium sp. X23]
MKLDRLISILVLLLRKDRVQAKELAETFGVSVRTILRDVDAINLAGIPIVTYQGLNGGIGIAEGYRLDRTILSSDDMASIITSLKGVGGVIPGSKHEILLEKLKNIMSLSQLEALDLKTSQLIIDPSPWYGTGYIKEKTMIIRKAVEDFKEIRFNYWDSSGNKTARTVEPYSLIMKGQNWYLYAWCLIRKDFRIFKLSRIKDLQVTTRIFNPRKIPEENVLLNNEWQKSENLVCLELVFEKEMETIVQDWFGEEGIENGSGQIMVKTVLPENNWLYGFLLSFGNGIEVIHPPHIRSTLANIAEQIYKKYLPKT